LTKPKKQSVSTKKLVLAPNLGLVVKLWHIAIASLLNFVFYMLQQKRYSMEISFWLRSVKNSEQLFMVYCAISINGDREKGAFSTGVKVAETDWCRQQQRIKDKNGKVIQNHVDNQILDRHYADLKSMYLQLTAMQKPLNARKMKEYYLQGFDFTEREFLHYAQEYVQNRNKLVGKLITQATAIRGRQWLRRVTVWLQARKQEHILLNEIKIKQFNDFVNYQLTEAKFIKHKKECIGYDAELVRKDASFFKTIIKEAYKEELIDKNLIRDEKIKVPKEQKEVVFLEDFELDKIHHHHFANEHLQRIADLFVFQSYTGFAYIDLMNFDFSKDTILAPDGKVWISKDRTKSGSQALVPFFKKSRQIWNKYKGNLPKIANGNYNAYLKEIAVIVGIGKNLTTHVARRTAAMLFLEHHCDLDTVAKMCGHNNAKMTKKYYTKIRIQRITAQLSNNGRLEW
jgi:integrase/recombinase XerD